jgi:hypothetical protein
MVQSLICFLRGRNPKKGQAKSLRATITSPSIYTGIAIAGKLCNR